uniref:plasma kallikrein-like isoform X1 n=1 Tax=Styela clava TaxID=7725 RepID=UPI00193A234F|nr:plasma kallikrein-like isoform X1 [Styela clava]
MLASYCDQDFMSTCDLTCNRCGQSGSSVSGGGAWSVCSKPCGIGTRYRQISSTTEYQSCNIHACPSISCPATYRYGYRVEREQRYELPHSCCDVDDYATCGKSFLTSGQRVTGGKDALRKQWPWLVAMFNRRWTLLSGGTLIGTRYVLTATHNFFDGNMIPYKKSDYTVYFGMLTLSDTYTNSKISQLFHYSGTNFKFPYDDITIVKVATPVRFSSLIQPICLPGGEVTPKDTTCFIAGWGSTGTPNKASWHLQELGIQNFDVNVCKTKYKNYHDMNQYMPFLNAGRKYLCAGSLHRSAGSCEGDSGGPLMCQKCSSCRWYLAGIVSFGLTDCTTWGVPSIYTKVTDYEIWIRTITQESASSPTCNYNGAVP